MPVIARIRPIAHSIGIVLKKAFTKQRYTALKGIRSMWDTLEFLLSQDLISISIA